MEIWKNIKGIEFYQVSNHGRIRSCNRQSWTNNRFSTFSREFTGRILKQNPNKWGYLGVMLCVRSKRFRKLVSRMVAEAFIPNPENKPQVNHKDGNKKNNKAENLEWCTAKENTIHAYENNLSSNQGVKNSQAKLTEKDVIEIRKSKDGGVTLSQKYNVSQMTISDIRLRRSWKHIH